VILADHQCLKAAVYMLQGSKWRVCSILILEIDVIFKFKHSNCTLSGFGGGHFARLLLIDSVNALCRRSKCLFYFVISASNDDDDDVDVSIQCNPIPLFRLNECTNFIPHTQSTITSKQNIV